MFDFNTTNAIAVLFEARPGFVKDYKSAVRNFREDCRYTTNLPNLEPGRARVEKWIKEFNEELEATFTQEEMELIRQIRLYNNYPVYKHAMTKDKMRELRAKFWGEA